MGCWTSKTVKPDEAVTVLPPEETVKEPPEQTVPPIVFKKMGESDPIV